MLREVVARIEEGAVSIDLAREAPFALADMRVSPSSRELLVGGGAVMLQPRIMQVLVALARRRGAVVSRDELIAACWSGRTVGEDAISRCIQAIRRIAEQQGGFGVQTVARVGYRLVETPPSSDPALAATSPREEGRAGARPAPAERQTERRHLTVLCCALVRGAGAAAPVDPEEWRVTLEQYHRAVSEAVGPFGGHMAKGLGDNLTVHFGYPEAREDAAECAVRAGLAIIDRLGAQGAGVAVRIGIHAGVVVVAQHGQDLEMFGEPPDGAAKVQALAAPGSVVVTSAVQALVTGLFVLEAQAPGPPVGGAALSPVYRVISAIPVSHLGSGFITRDQSPYVGRDEEMRLLLARWARVGRGEGQFVLLVGEPGIGKTRLIQEFRKRIEGEPHLWVQCAGQRLNVNTPFHAAARLLEQVFGWRGDESRADRIEALEQAFSRAGVELTEAAPLVAELLNLDVAGRYPPLTLSADQKRERLLACLAALVFSLARDAPLIVVVEDLLWVDPSTMELLQALAEQGATGPVLLLCTARPEFRAPWPTRAHHALLYLDRLNHDETRELVVGVVAKAGLSQDVIDTVIKRTDGVPLFAEELTRLMLESDGRAGDHDIPATLHDSLAARLARTGRAEEVAQLGAVLGREFSYALIAAVSPAPAEQLQADLAKLADAELIYVHGAPPEANYQFKHALILDAALDALLKSRRRALHAHVARTISEQFPALALDQPEVLAGHWTEAGEPDKAVTAWAQAATLASARHAYREAMQSYRQALVGLPALPKAPERDARELALVYALAAIAGVVHGHASEVYRELHDRAAGLAGPGPRGPDRKKIGN